MERKRKFHLTLIIVIYKLFLRFAIMSLKPHLDELLDKDDDIGIYDVIKSRTKYINNIQLFLRNNGMSKSKYDWVEVISTIYFLCLGKSEWERWASIDNYNDAEEAFRSFYDIHEIKRSMNQYVSYLGIMNYSCFDKILNHISQEKSFVVILKSFLFCTYNACDKDKWEEFYLVFIKPQMEIKSYWELEIFSRWKFEYIDEYVVNLAEYIKYHQRARREINTDSITVFRDR